MTLLTEPTRIVLAKGQPVPVDPRFWQRFSAAPR
jgi:hypothetical protein